MKIKLSPENIGERIALMFNLAPQPLVETQIFYTVARTIMAGATLGIYDAMGKSAKSPEEIAQQCKTNPDATRKLLNALVGIGYLTHNEGMYALRPKFYKWLLSEYETNLINKMKMQVYEWDFMAHTEEYVRTGKPMELHENIHNQDFWQVYQEGMRDLSIGAAKELAGRLRLSQNPTRMLDIGGSHGLFSIELCRKYPSLSSTILELPDAVQHASNIAGRYNMQGQVSYQAGNALTDDLGTEVYDLVLINNVVHHFTDSQNEMLAKKVAKALKPGGSYAIGDSYREHRPGSGGLVGATLDLYFSLTSSSGTWSIEEMQGWQQKAGLQLKKPITLRSLPGYVSVIGSKG